MFGNVLSFIFKKRLQLLELITIAQFLEARADPGAGFEILLEPEPEK